MREIAFRDALREAMSGEMRRDERVFLIGEEVAQYDGAYKVSKGMLEEFGARRVVDTPISESGFAGLSIGAAMMGLRPIVEFMSWSFSLVAADPILNNAAKMLYMSGGQFGCPIVFRGNNGAGGQLGSTHSWCVESLYANVPGLKIIIPSTPYTAKGLLTQAIRDDNPVFCLENERMLAMTGDVPEESYTLPIGKAELIRSGNDCTIVSFGRPLYFCLEAAEELAREGIECEIIDGRSIRPLDIDTIAASVCRTNYCVVVDQSWSFASVGSEVAAEVHRVCFDDLDNYVYRVHSDDVPAPYAKGLEQEMLPNARKICEAVRSVTYNA
ncbi:MAG: pyruvate dehydrogenase complex E1 component subunit beta [Phycisphaerales bacterium]|jgi:pyruvate dehydrogenase E1 component beta subunit|nr:pyruvate dehydrogenase complex E1 component subunit beta [Phycisphaerales bacterium]MDP6312294.1 pyruvate dehydrogenase complex E1 component subunit beta [Phycisphaerales bacterium]MDP7086107.1 pyruvate dehydrogenase complex E1 component subunit beta [Phycisphaerales bacterium]MDP7188243.1 pyruvate dehydrogenase complex E1 component subunit beta [Phycisphaerales bacterium]MDP7518634.1 pyruvate dehydrogenase complex E1 component subunit beta [Phycisphaerales bacterium]|tara:strand:- start:249 stop:1229 length:981 start_codon:yes stop_codon:yes gene_type:complete